MLVDEVCSRSSVPLMNCNTNMHDVTSKNNSLELYKVCVTGEEPAIVYGPVTFKTSVVRKKAALYCIIQDYSRGFCWYIIVVHQDA